MAWEVTASSSLPIKDIAWDGPSARRRMIDAGLDVAKLGHLLHDSTGGTDGKGDRVADFKVPIGDYKNGELYAVVAGLRAAATRLPQVKGVPQSKIDQARKVLDGYFAKMKKSTISPIAQAWRNFRDMFQTSISRDIAMMSIGQQVMYALDEYNSQMTGPEGSDPGGMSGDMSGNDYHWLQDLYVADDQSLFAITCSNGKLYRWPIQVGTDNTVTLSPAQEVKPMFATPQAQTLKKIQKRTDGRYEGFAIMGTCALNKDGEIDTRRLFDCFVNRFKGNREYINIYHLGGDVTRIGEITMIFREGNLLVGHYVLDDNPVANAAGATLAADTNGEWGGSIEFLSDDAGTPVEIAQGIIANMYLSGTLQGFSIARAIRGAAWGTSHYLTRTPIMDKKTLADITQLLGNDPAALQEFESWVDGANLRLKDSITRTTEEPTADPVVVAQATAPVTQAVTPLPDGTMPEITVDDDLLAAITQAVQDSEWFRAATGFQVEFGTRLSAIEQSIADLQNAATAPATITSAPAETPVATPAPAPQAQTAEDIAADEALEARLGAIEQVVNQLSSFYERSKPQTAQVATYRPGRSTTPQAQGVKPPAVVFNNQMAQVLPVQVIAQAQPTSLKALWKRPSKTLDRNRN